MKPARLVTSLIEDRKAAATRIAELEKAAAGEGDRTWTAVAQALADADEAHHKELSGIRDELAAIMKYAEDAKARILVLAAAIVDVESQRDDADTKVRVLEAALSEAKDKLSEARPQLELVEKKKDELTHILDAVRDRMRRKELQEEQAILNRATVAGARPRRNWG